MRPGPYRILLCLALSSLCLSTGGFSQRRATASAGASASTPSVATAAAQAEIPYIEAGADRPAIVVPADARSPARSVAIGRTGDRFASLTAVGGALLTVGTRPDPELGERLVIAGLDGTRAPIAEIDGPPSFTGARQGGAQLLARAGVGATESRLAQPFTVAWFEGETPRHNQLFAADWIGDGFARARRVAGVGPGSQVALQSATLPSGAQLLVWTAFDGEDSETVWSMRSADRSPADDAWSKAARLHGNNRVDDITPALIATDAGALAVWARFSGESYSLVISSFDGETWSEPQAVGEGNGIYPRFRRGAAEPLLSFRSATPNRWNYRTLDAAGRTLRVASLEATSAANRPQVLASGAKHLVLAESTASTPTPSARVAATSADGTVRVAWQ